MTPPYDPNRRRDVADSAFRIQVLAVIDQLHEEARTSQIAGRVHQADRLEAMAHKLAARLKAYESAVDEWSVTA